MSDEEPDQIIYVTTGAIEFCWPVTIRETTGKDISGDTIELSLGTSRLPGSWVAPDMDRPGAGVNERIVQLLIGDTLRPDPGEYWLWSKVVDAPEIPERQHQRIHVR